MYGPFLHAAIILFREGLEAMLIIAAVVVYLDKVGARSRLPDLYFGAAAAIVVSIIAAWIFVVYNDGRHNDIIEGIVMLCAAALMFYVSGWLWVRQDPRAMKRRILAQTEAALAKRTSLAIALLAFLAVFREGAETVLFLRVLVTVSGFTVSVFAGLITAAIALVAVFIAINSVARRIPLRPLFVVTSLFLFVMAVMFVGNAVFEFQEEKIIPYTEFAGSGFLKMMGFNPTIEAVAAQLAVILVVGLTFNFVERPGLRAQT
jgi:high-affinity iron transporter